MNSLEWESANGHVQNMEEEVVEAHGKRKNLLWIIPLACFVLMVFSPFLLAPVYNRWAAHAFERHIAELEAIGETLDIEKLKPEPFEHPEKTFAHHPLIVRLIDEAEKGDSEDPDLLLNRLSVNAIPAELESKERISPMFFGEKRLRDIALKAGEEGAAKMVLAYCETLSKELSEYAEASELDGGHFETPYETDLSFPWFETTPVRTISELLAVRGSSRVAAGDSQAAGEDVHTLLLGYRQVCEEPNRIVQVSALRTHNLAIGLIHEGLIRKAWTPSQLAQFDERIAAIDTDSSLLRALRMERAVDVAMIKSITRKSRGASGVKPTTNWFLNNSPTLLSGCCYENARMLSNLFQRELLSDSAGQSRWNVLPKESVLEERVLDFESNPIRKHQYSLVSAMAPSSISDTLNYFHRSRVYRDHARIALALERHRLETGSFPSTLDPLIAASPDLPVTDPFSGSRYIYETGPVDTYQLYSVGPNRTDEGGMWKKKLEKGDWVWSLTLPTDFNWDDYVN